MENNFEKLTINLDRLQKSIKSAEKEESKALGVKGVHIFWIYALLEHPEGLSEAEIATKSKVNRSLVSRELALLIEKNIVEKRINGTRYNAKLFLTEKGEKVAKHIYDRSMELQGLIRDEITMEELDIFYSVLERMSVTFSKFY